MDYSREEGQFLVRTLNDMDFDIMDDLVDYRPQDKREATVQRE